MFDRNFFEHVLDQHASEKKEESANGGVRVVFVTAASHTIAVRGILEVADGYVIVEAVPERPREVREDKRKSAEVSEVDYDRLAIPIEQVVSVTVTTEKRDRRGVGFRIKE